MCAECEQNNTPQKFSHIKNPSQRKQARTRHPAYWSWRAMMKRCYYPEVKEYRYYGSLGVTVHRPWHDFNLFKDALPPRPKGTTLDRINPFGNYEPSNVRWATRREQNQNTRRAYRMKNPIKDE
jgi:hypothetical protein